MSDESRGVVYVSEGELSPGRGEPILVVPISPIGMPDWSRSTFGVVGEVGERWINTTTLLWVPRHAYSAWEHQCSTMAGLVAGRHIAVPFRSMLYHEIVEDRRSELWVGAARLASDDAARTRALEEAKQEIRGLRKRMRVEREVTTGIFTGLLDKEATERFIAHLERLVKRIEAAEVSSVRVRADASAEEPPLDRAFAKAVLDTTYVLAAAERGTPPDLVDAALANGVEQLHAIVKSTRTQPTEAPAKPAVDPEVIGELGTIVGLLEKHVVRADDISGTEATLNDLWWRIRKVREKLQATA